MTAGTQDGDRWTVDTISCAVVRLLTEGVYHTYPVQHKRLNKLPRQYYGQFMLFGHILCALVNSCTIHIISFSNSQGCLLKLSRYNRVLFLLFNLICLTGTQIRQIRQDGQTP